MSSEEDFSEEEEAGFDEDVSDEEPGFAEDDETPGYKETLHTTREEAKGKLDASDMFLINLEKKLEEYACWKTIKSNEDELLEFRTKVRSLPNMLLLNIPLLALAVCFDYTYKGLVNNRNVGEFIGMHGRKSEGQEGPKKRGKKSKEEIQQDYDAIDIIRYVRYYVHYSTI